jgi:para-aminobenzoate synthetase component 1
VRKQQTFKIEDGNDLKKKALLWASRFPVFTYLNHNHIDFPHDAFPEVLAAGAINEIIPSNGKPFEELKGFYNKHQDVLFGFFAYDLKNEIENLSSNNPDGINFPDLYFYRPQHLLYFNSEEISIHSTENPEKIYKEIESLVIPLPGKIKPLNIQQNLSKEAYLKNVGLIKNHLLDGDIYELNYCLEFYAENADLEPIQIYAELNESSPMPFSAFHKLNDKYLICASPERFMKKVKHELISQPIKGTAKRGKNEEEDKILKDHLRSSPKERSENMMIVDLVRNDLARSSVPGSVKVEEMFGIYSFRQVHQMISTVVSELKKEIHPVDAIKNAFPMGSMTGAPKISAMQLIEKYEKTKRGLFSGAIGYIDQDGDFDFNVVIRSILYNASNRYLSFQAGSAITHLSDPEKEYEECLLKAAAIRKVLSL